LILERHQAAAGRLFTADHHKQFGVLVSGSILALGQLDQNRVPGIGVKDHGQHNQTSLTGREDQALTCPLHTTLTLSLTLTTILSLKYF